MNEKNFSKAALTYESNAVIQKKLAQKMISFIANKEYVDVLEIGAGPGILSRLLIDNVNITNLTINDVSNDMLSLCKDALEPYKDKVNIEYINEDCTKFKFSKKYDLIISNATFQWFYDFDKSLDHLKKYLKNDGSLVFSSFSENNFKEIKSLLKLGLNYKSLFDVDKYLTKSFKTHLLLDFEETMFFDNPLLVLKHIKATGTKISDKNLSVSTLRKFIKDYEKLRKLDKETNEKRIPLSWYPYIVIARNKII